jgi:hypothetical protein
MKTTISLLFLSLLSLNLNAQPVLKSTIALTSGTGLCQIKTTDEQVLQLNVDSNYIYALTNKNRLMLLDRVNIAHPCSNDVSNADLGSSFAVNATAGIFYISAADATVVKYATATDFVTTNTVTMNLGTVQIQAVDKLFLKGNKLFAIARLLTTNMPVLLKAEVSDPTTATFSVWRNVVDELAPYYTAQSITASDNMLFMSTLSGTDLTARVMHTDITDDNPDAAFVDLVDLRTLQISPCAYSNVTLRPWNEILYIYNNNTSYYPKQLMIADEISNYPRMWYKTVDYSVPVHNLYAIAGDTNNPSCPAYKPATPDPLHPEYGWSDLGSYGVKPTSMVHYNNQDIYLLVTPIAGADQPVYIYEFKFWDNVGIDENRAADNSIIKDFASDGGNLSMTFSSAGKYSISVFDVAGRNVVPVKTISGDSYTVDMSDASKGIYAVKITDSEHKRTQTLKFAR